MSNLAILIDGRVVPTEDAAKWGDWMKENRDQRIIGRTHSDHALVSTVFLGVDHGFESPLWFETMIFGGEHDELQWRYETLEQAEAGHEAAVNLVAGNHAQDESDGS